MKTERFDDEIRRKLLGLPVDTNSGEVDRIHTHVRTNLAGFTHTFWKKRGLLVATSLLLVVSLVYNAVLSHQNSRLLAALATAREGQNQMANQEQPGTLSAFRPWPETPTGHAPPPTNIRPPLISQVDERPQRGASLTTLRGNGQTQGYAGQVTAQAESSRNRRKLTGQNSEPMRHIPADGSEIKLKMPIVPVDEISAWAPRRSKTHTVKTPGQHFRRETALDNRVNSRINPASRNSLNGHRHSSRDVEVTPAIRQSTGTAPPYRLNLAGQARNGRLVTEPSDTDGMTAFSATDRSQEPGQEIHRLTLVLESLPSQPVNPLAGIRAVVNPKHLLSLPLPKAPKTRTKGPFSLPTVAIPDVQYRVGGGLTLGLNNQLGGSLLGEIALNRHWSIQAGIQVLSSPGFHYRDERDFNDQQSDNFRQAYAAQLPLTAVIEDIRQVAVCLQVPLQLAYHWPLGPQWRLRLGLGTDLTLRGHNTVSYEYEENSHAYKGEFTQVESPEHVFTNVTVNPTLEWYRKKWLLRAGPLISQPVRAVRDQTNGHYWGANVQVLYQLGK